jgi:hypothetical protein
MKAGLRIMRRVGQQNQRHRSSVVEHTLGKGEVEGSIPFGGFGGASNGVVERSERVGVFP